MISNSTQTGRGGVVVNCQLPNSHCISVPPPPPPTKVQPVPEPAGFGILLTALVVLLIIRRSV